MAAMLGLWILFGLIISTVMIIDLGVLQKRAHTISFKESALWSSLWVTLAMAFAGAVWSVKGREMALQFVAGYLLEESLSVDNMFVFVMIFQYFAIPPQFQSRILHWGILGAIVMRFFFIFIGVSLINAFHWMIYVFGALLLFTGLKMAFQEESAEPELEKNPAIRLLRRFMPLTKEFHGQSFFTRVGGVLHATPLFAALMVVEFSDVIFAIDSIPAVIAITPDTFVVYTSNIFAIMGLRALYFMLSGLVGMFHYLKLGISVILCFVGVKMLVGPWYHVPIGASLGIIAGILAACIAASLLVPKKK
jgi:tellurite resistance protein TerC